MVNVISYIDKYGNETFKDKSINEIDYAILTVLSYINYDGILHKDDTKVKLNKALKDFFNKYDNKELTNHGVGLKDSYKIAKALIGKKRYKDLELYNYEYITNDKLQFSAMCIDIDENLVFVSIEGTDDEVVGWKEDFQLSYIFPIPAQRACIKYLKKNISLLSNKKYILSGHSKGGNLALVGAMYMPFLKQHKIEAVYSFDGPGLNKKELSSYRYLYIKNRYHLIIPNYSIVGLLLNNKDTYKIVSSYKKGLYAHSVYNWRISGDSFYEVDELSNFSKNVDKTITKWLELYDFDTRKRFVEDLFDIFERCNIKTLYKIHAKDLKAISLVIKESNNLSKESKKMLKELLSILVQTVKEDTFSIFKSKQD
jgi:hypothetical protein